MLLPRKSVTTRVAAWSAAHPWRAIIGWLLFVVLCLGAGIAAGTNNAGTEDYWIGEAGRAEELATGAGLQRQPGEHILIRARGGPLDLDAARAAARDVSARMAALPEVSHVSPAARSADGGMLMVAVTLKGAELDARKHVDPLLAQTAAAQRAHPGLIVEQTGTASISKGVNDQRGDDLARSEAISFPVTLVTLLLVFGSVLMAAVPLLLALSSIAAAMGLSMLVSHLLPDAGVGSNVILLIGMAVGVDYTLFYLKREREERARAGGRLSAHAIVELAAATSGRAVVVSGLAVLVSTATLYLAADVVFSSLATGTVLVVLVAMASSMTVLPALLVKLALRAERRTLATAGARQRRAGSRFWRARQQRSDGRLWQVILRPAAHRPALTLALATLAMLALALPALGMELRVLNRDSHSREIPALRVHDRMTAAFPELRTRHQIVVRDPRGRTAEVERALRDLGARAQADPLFAKGAKPEIRTSGQVSVLELAVPDKLSSPGAERSLARIRDTYLPATVGALAGVEAAVTGDAARNVDDLAHVNAKLPLVAGLLLLITLIMTAIVFRSVTLGLLGVLLNCLSAAASFGLVVVFFQYGAATTLFGFDPAATGAIGSRVPLFLLVILFGLSMDYQVFVVSRIREKAAAGLPPRQAVLEGITGSAGVVTSAAIVMVTVFAGFVFLHLAELKQIGFSLAVAVLLDAFVIRTTILPAAMILLGRWNWWPSRLSRGVLGQPVASPRDQRLEVR
ncbi:MMPL family transporter [Nonomuraea sp. NBC_01738]|uniref:MMPL family transporter n=1 Tax=Nonomuraea sp. NBC_01738 TaxID=2976003 RepID=UPI002E155515|nr:MMPL family transporter [Nonomuraea sp. NBC_01738]